MAIPLEIPDANTIAAIYGAGGVILGAVVSSIFQYLGVREANTSAKLDREFSFNERRLSTLQEKAIECINVILRYDNIVETMKVELENQVIEIAIGKDRLKQLEGHLDIKAKLFTQICIFFPLLENQYEDFSRTFSAYMDKYMEIAESAIKTHGYKISRNDQLLMPKLHLKYYESRVKFIDSLQKEVEKARIF